MLRISRAETDCLRCDRIVRFDDIHEVSGRSVPDGNRWYQDNIMQCFHQQADVHELIWKQSALRVIEDGPQLHARSVQIYLVVDGLKQACREFDGAGSVISRDRQFGVRLQPLCDDRQIILR